MGFSKQPREMGQIAAHSMVLPVALGRLVPNPSTPTVQSRWTSCPISILSLGKGPGNENPKPKEIRMVLL